MNNRIKLFVAAFLLCVLPLKHWAQTPYSQYADEGILMDFFEIDNHDFRLFLLYNLCQDERFNLIPEEENGLFAVVPASENAESAFIDDFEDFYSHTLASFSTLSKPEIFDLIPVWKSGVPSMAFTSITMDLALNRATTLNNHCVDSDPFCTSDVISFNAANSSQTAEDLEGQTFDDGCIGSSYNPSWYHMRINTPGQFIIHMEGHDPQTNYDRDIDFCMWGPFEDPIAPCVAQLTSSKIIDCNYSSSYSEDIFLGYPENEHYHQADHQTINFHMPETGEYYILMITNYSREPCTISFTKTEGSGPGTTDCGILPGIATNEGPYCVGETIQLSITTQAGATYSWTGPDNFNSNEQNPTIPNCSFEMGGTYTCVTTVDGESTTGSTEVVVYAQPVADFSFNNVCEGTSTQLNSTANTEPAGQEITGYYWDFGDGVTAEGANQIHTYAAPGEYQVTHTIHTGNGHCVDEIVQTVSVYYIPVGTASANPTSVLFGGTSTLTAEVENPGSYSFHWEPANMVLNPDSQTTQTVPIEETQIFTVTITNLDGGCTSTTQTTVIMAGSNMTATATADSYILCEGDRTTLHVEAIAGTGVYTYSWSPANTLSNATIPNPVATPPVGSTTYTCTVNDGYTTQQVDVTINVYSHIDNAPVEVTACDEYKWIGDTYTQTGFYTQNLYTIHGCDSIVHLDLTMQYTPDPTPIYPKDPNNDTPHWVVTATEFQINTYDFYFWDNNSRCHWDSISWSFENQGIEWVLEPDTTTLPKGQSCKMFVMEQVDDTVWLCAKAYNSCEPQGVASRYWFVCSFFGTEENTAIGKADFNVVPNPNNGQMTLNFEHLAGLLEVKVYDIRGTLIDQFEVVNDADAHSMPYSLDTRNSGVYLFVVNGKNGTLTKRVVMMP